MQVKRKNSRKEAERDFKIGGSEIVKLLKYLLQNCKHETYVIKGYLRRTQLLSPFNRKGRSNLAWKTILNVTLNVSHIKYHNTN